MAGYFLVERDIFAHPLFATSQPFSRREAWLWTIANANFQPGHFRDGANFHSIPRGCLATRFRALAREWNWSVNRVIRELEMWEKRNMIVSKTEQGFLMITICKYETYQTRERINGTVTEQQRNSDGTATDTNQKKETKETNTSSYSSAFEEWYRAYPLKKGKQVAQRAFLVAQSKVSQEVLMATARLYAAECVRDGTQPRYMAHPTTWLNEERWHNHQRAEPPKYSKAELGL